MVEKEATVVPEAGLPARPAARFVKEAKGYSSTIVVTKDGREANAKSSLRLMALGAKHGEKVVVRAEGEEELGRFRDAVEVVTKSLSATAEELRERGKEDEAGIFEAHVEMAEDPEF